MHHLKNSFALAALLLAACRIERPPPVIDVEDAWARATVPGQSSSAAYFTVANLGGEDRLVGVSSPVGQASIHSTSMDGSVMRMRPVEFVEIPANSTVTLRPGGTHLMLTGLPAPLSPGSAVPLELRFERSGKMQVDAAVRGAAPGGVEM
jgi:copper(I)-binding protein